MRGDVLGRRSRQRCALTACLGSETIPLAPHVQGRVGIGAVSRTVSRTGQAAMHEFTSPNRRRFLKLSGGIVAGIIVSVAFIRRAAAALLHLNAETNATAKALHYTDSAKQATVHHPPMEHCMMCQHYKGHMGEASGPCEIFPGYDVNAMGWCSAYKARMSMMHMMSGKG